VLPDSSNGHGLISVLSNSEVNRDVDSIGNYRFGRLARLLQSAATPSAPNTIEISAPLSELASMAETAPPLLIKNMIMAAHCRRRTQGCSGTTRNRERINLAELALKKYLSIEGALPVDSKSRCETTNDRDNELF
jgi:hypothetical protein